MYRENDHVVNLFSGEYVAVTADRDDYGRDYYIIREASNDLDHLKQNWTSYRASYLTMEEYKRLRPLT